MIASHIHDALRQVDRMRELALERARFRGYSGRARMLGGVVALIGAAVMDCPSIPRTPDAHLAGWGIVLTVALILNYSGLWIWFRRDPAAAQDRWQLLPAVDILPALAVGAFLSVALVLHGEHNLLFGVWMLLYGAGHAPYRHTLPRANLLVGLFYVMAGAVCLLHPAVRFTNPWPMGLAFGVGELAGGWIFRSK